MFFDYYDEMSGVDQGYNVNESMDLVVESYINDYTIFEAVLKRDFLEATDMLTEASEKSFLRGLWEKVLNLIDAIKKKVMDIIRSFVNKLDEIKKNQAKKLVDKYKRFFEKDKNHDLDEFTMSGFNFKLEKGGDQHIASKIILSIGESIKNSIKPISQMSKTDIQNCLDEIDKETRNIKDIKKEYKEIFFDPDDDVENPFKTIGVDTIKNFILRKTDDCRSIKNLKKDLSATLEHLKRGAKAYMQNVDRNTDISDAKGKEKRSEEINKAQLYLRLVNGLQSQLSSVVSYSLKLIGQGYKQCVKAWTQAGKFLEGKQKDNDEDTKNESTSYLFGDNDYDYYTEGYDSDFLEAFAEAEIFDVSLEDFE